MRKYEEKKEIILDEYSYAKMKEEICDLKFQLFQLSLLNIIKDIMIKDFNFSVALDTKMILSLINALEESKDKKLFDEDTKFSFTTKYDYFISKVKLFLISIVEKIDSDGEIFIDNVFKKINELNIKERSFSNE